MNEQEYKQKINECIRRIENQRTEINRLSEINKKLSEGNIFGCFQEMIKEFSNKFEIGQIYFCRECPHCQTPLDIKMVYEYDKENNICRCDFIGLIKA